jgi:hypothetical protein
MSTHSSILFHIYIFQNLALCVCPALCFFISNIYNTTQITQHVLGRKLYGSKMLRGQKCVNILWLNIKVA